MKQVRQFMLIVLMFCLFMFNACNRRSLETHSSLDMQSPRIFGDIPHGQAEELFKLAEKYKTAVNDKDIKALERIVHPDIFLGLSKEQKAALRGIYLRCRLNPSIKKIDYIQCIKLGSDEKEKLEEEWNVPWRIKPDLRMNISHQTGPDRWRVEHLYLATKDNRWYLVIPVPPDYAVQRWNAHVSQHITNGIGADE